MRLRGPEMTYHFGTFRHAPPAERTIGNNRGWSTKGSHCSKLSKRRRLSARTNTEMTLTQRQNEKHVNFVSLIARGAADRPVDARFAAVSMHPRIKVKYHYWCTHFRRRLRTLGLPSAITELCSLKPRGAADTVTDRSMENLQRFRCIAFGKIKAVLWLFCKIYQKVVENMGRLRLTDWATPSLHSCCEGCGGVSRECLWRKPVPKS